MKLFACLLAPRDQSIPDSARSAIEKFPRAHAIPFYWTECEQAAVLIGGHAPNDGPPVARYAGRLAVGSVRLDNRIDCERWAACDSSSLTDIELVLRVVVQHGPDYISRFVGDFAFIVWHPSTAVALAACDAFAVKKLYYAQRDGLLCFSSRSAALAYDNDYDTQYFAEQVAVCVPTPGLTPYRGVSAVPPASIVDVRNGRTHTSSYWSPFDFAFGPPSTRSQSEAVAICRDLLRDAVQSRLTGSPDVWAHLSGGLDSSSVVSLAQWLATTGATPQGLAGTITYVDSHGTGADEREYSEAVVARWNVRNETIVDPPVWYDERFPLPDTDAPRVGLIFYPRECLLCATIRGAGGHVVLTGAGGDTLFAGSMFFFADWLSRGRIRPTMREMLHRAAIGRVSFWELAYRNVILPLLPPSVQRRLVVDPGQMPPWLLQTAISRYGLSERSFVYDSYAGPRGHKYQHAVATGVAAMVGNLVHGVIEDHFDVRHPYLHRPLVEFALGLPPEMCARPNARKWILREAMRGILPDLVRERVGKGAPNGRLAWAIRAHRNVLAPLAQEPILADLGVVDATKLYSSFRAAQEQGDNREHIQVAVQHTLAIEAWLQMRSGRWPRGTRSDADRHTAVYTALR